MQVAYLCLGVGIAAASSGSAYADPVLVSEGPPPADFMLTWSSQAEAPKEGDPGLLFSEDAWNDALTCPESAVEVQPASHMRCRYGSTAALKVGAGLLWVGVTMADHEFDGMYGHNESLVLIVAPTPTRPARLAHTLYQWNHSVVDNRTSVLVRRQRVIDLDRDGVTELCIESVEETGVGLFEVMDLGDRHQRWRPLEKKRALSAWRFDVRAGALRAEPSLAARCPRGGYRPFAKTPVVDDPIGWRRDVDRSGWRR